MGKENKLHIGIYGRRNVGKSSLINFLCGQQIAIVSEQAGTTTDPVKRSFELLGAGIVILIDTAGVDDLEGVGIQRVERSIETLRTIDAALLVTDNPSLGEWEYKLIAKFQKAEIPFLLVLNKVDSFSPNISIDIPIPYVPISAKTNHGREALLDAVKKMLPKPNPALLMGDLIKAGDVVLLITPIDSEAPQGRLILPQVTAIRDILDNSAIAIVLKETEVAAFMRNAQIKPTLAVTDSQIFKQADKLIPKEIPLTSFSILMARMKGNFEAYLQGVHAISQLKDGDKVLLLENCSHQTSCDDIGRVKIPAWICKFTGKQLEFDMAQGLDKLIHPISDYALAIQCGGCMVTHRQLYNRLKPIIEAGIPVTNYGMAIAYTQGIFDRATKMFIK